MAYVSHTLNNKMNMDPHVTPQRWLSHVKEHGSKLLENLFYISSGRSTKETLLTLSHFSRPSKTHRTEPAALTYRTCTT